MSKLLDGKKIRDTQEEVLKQVCASLSEPVSLVIVDIGGSPVTAAYVRQKQMFGERIGVNVVHKIFTNESEEDIIAFIEKKNNDDTVHGIIIQLPIPNTYNAENLLQAIAPHKDVDGLTEQNRNALYTGERPLFVPAPARGVIELLEAYQFEFAGKALVIGNSLIAGKPISEILKVRGMDVFVATKDTEDIPARARESALLVSATGVPHLVGTTFVHHNQWIVDIGFSHIEIDGHMKVVGDVNFAEVQNVVSAITPVPGGVGPMAVLALFENLLHVSFTI